VQHDLDERDEGRAESVQLPVRPRLLAAVALAAAAAGCGGSEKPKSAPAPQRPVVLVSGRDDHGLLARRSIALLDEPEGRPVSRVADGTLAAVTGSRGEWLRVRALEGPRAGGWVDDFYLRGTAHVVPTGGSCAVRAYARAGAGRSRPLPASAQVELLGVERAEGGAWVHVRALAPARDAWVPRAAVRELAIRPAASCKR
jgi:hypothetical protein